MDSSLHESNLVVSAGTSIKDAMAAITDNRRGAVVVVDANMHLLGVLSDGDIRRALVRGTEMHSPVEKIMNVNPTYVIQDEKMEEHIQSLFERELGIMIVPIVGEANILSDVRKRPE